MDRFCGKCGARLDERTGLCPVCDPTADIINTVRSRAEEETVVPESDPVRQTAAPQPQGQPVRRMAYCARCGSALDAWGHCPACGWTAVQSVQQTVERTVNGGGQDTRHKQYVKDVYEEPKKEDRTTDILKRAICIVAALIVLLAVGTGVLVYLDVLDIPPVAKFYDAIGLKPYTNGQNGGSQDQPRQDAANNDLPAGTGQDNAAQAPYTQQRLKLVSSGSRGTLTLSEWQEDGTWRELCAVTAYLGDNGVTWNKRDGDKATPAGEFDILYYIGINDRGSNLKYVPISDGDVWVCDPDSLYYNTMQRNSGTRDWDAAQAENLYRKFHDDYSAACIMFNYNGDGLRSDTAVSGKGSDIFIDGVGSKGNLTSGYGDIKITANDMLMLLGYLDSDKHPTLTVS